VETTMKKRNPFMILCGDCGALICYKCAQYEDRLNEPDDGPSTDPRKSQRIYAQMEKHMAEYEHLGIHSN
jgi:hypothetical protein